MRVPFLLIFHLLAIPFVKAVEPITFVDADVCVLGATSGGVVAAVQCQRLGLSVCLIGLSDHLGGLSSGGLGATDVGNSSTIGGLSREFYQRVGAKYGLPERFTFEPKVARQVFQDMLDEAGIVPLYNRKPTGVVTNASRITRLLLDDSTVVRARMFIDATYEGDLMPLAGVSHTHGREPVAQHGESLNGIRGSTPSHQFSVAVDPYLIPGDAASGLLPLVNGTDPGVPGQGDARIQAYNYRLCFTTATNRLPHAVPPDYDPARYELLARYVEARVSAGQSTARSAFFNVAGMPGGKTDINNNGAISTDYIGMNYEYPTASYARRAELDREHLHYIQGLVWFLASSPRVPAALRAEMLAFGPTRDEWVPTGGYSPQIYVREALRMVSDYVVTQRDCQYVVAAPDPVCLGSYNMDSHNCQRHVSAGAARNEGDVQSAPNGPYGISYRSLVPKTGECGNLFETFAISASHIAFGSTRMEPVFMMCAQVAADAAALAIRHGLDAQQVPYPTLAAQLRAEGQILTWGTSAVNTGIIVDNLQAEILGDWLGSTSRSGYYGANYIHDQNAGKGAKSVVFRPNLPAAGNYDVYLRWTTDANRATAVPVDVSASDGLTAHTVNMQADNGAWVLLRRASCAAGTNSFVRLRTDGTTGFIIADAARWMPAEQAGQATVEAHAVDPEAGETHGGGGRILLTRRMDDTSDPLLVSFQVGGTATPGADYVSLGTNATFAANQTALFLPLSPLPDQMVEGEETVSLTLLPAPGVVPGPNSSATLRVRDQPYDQWRAANLPPAGWGSPEALSRQADPDDDGIRNELEYALGLNPQVHDDQTKPEARWENTHLMLRYTLNRDAVDARLVGEGSASLSPLAWSSSLVETTAVEEVRATLDRITLRLRSPPADCQGALRLDLQAP